MRKGKTDASFKKASIRAAVLVLAVGLGISLLVSGGTFAKWTAAISQMTGANIQIGDWVAVEPPVISTDSKLPDANVGVEYRHQFEASNSDKATWNSFSLYGNLPSGLKLSSDGVLSGTPTYADTYNFRVTVKNSAGSDEQPFTLVIHPVAPIFAESQILPDAFDGVLYKNVTLSATGQSRVYEVTNGSLPKGLVLQRHGVISGTPVGYGTFTFTVTVSNGGGSDSKEFTINLTSDFPYITTTALPDATKNVWYSQLIAGSGPSPTYALVSGSLPSGMTLDASTGKISGTSNVHGLSNFTISKTNTMGTVTQDLSIYVRYVAPTITSTSLPTVRKNVAYSTQLTGVGEDSTFDVSEGRLPAGISLDPVTGVISGVATELGDFDFTITRTNESGIATKSFVLNSLLAVPKITTEYSLPVAYLENYYEMPITATGEEIVWSATGLLGGLSIDPATGIISGTPTLVGSASVYVTATNSGGSTTSLFSLHVKNTVPEITTTSMAPGEVGKYYSETFSATGMSITYTTSGTLPAGLKLDSATGVLSGTPTKSGTFNVTFNARTSGGTVSQLLPIVIESDVPVITTTSLPNAMQGTSYSAQIHGTGEDSKYTLTAGALPNGLYVGTSFNYGYISGTPSVTAAHGDYTFSVTKTNSRSAVTQEFTLRLAYQVPTLTGSTAITQGRLNQDYTFPLGGVGNGATYTVTDGALPAGITLNSSAGIISGSPAVTGDFPFTVQKSNESGTVSKTFTFKVVHVAPKMVTKAFDPATIRVPYSMQVQATGLDLVFSIGSGVLPDGLTLDPNTGVISGTPTVAVQASIRVYATNSGGQVELASQFNSNHVMPTVSTTSLPNGKVKDPYSAKIEVVGESVTYSASGLPSGMTIDTNTGVISGTPTNATTYSVTFTIRNIGNTVTQRIPITVVTQNPTITNESFPNGIVGSSYTQNLTGEGTSNTVTISKGELPPGLKMNIASGNVTGTPTTRGTYTFTMTKTNASGSTSKEFTIEVRYVTPTFTTPAAGSLKDAAIGQNYSLVIYGVGITATDGITYSIIEGELPPGISLDPQPTSLRLLGTPTTPGNYTFTILKSNLDGEVSRQFSIYVPGVKVASLSNEPSTGLVILRRLWE